MEVQEANTDLRAPPFTFAFNDEVDLRDIIAKGSFSFDDWTALILAVEDKFPDDIQKISLVYDSFLSEFPLCHGYWKRYAYQKMRLCGCDEAIEVFEVAMTCATYCVGLWVDYCQFAVSSLEDPRDVRRLFRRAVSFVGKDYLCHSLWDKYIEFEYSQQEWSSVAFIYIQILKFPTKKLRQYYDSFRMLITILKEEVVRGSGTASESNVEPKLDIEVQELNNDEISHVIRELCSIDGLARLRALEKFSAMGEKFYEESCQLDGKIVDFESRIRRSYFHVKPLDVDQIENWHLYLDFVEKQSDFDWCVKLYERCLVPAANYPEFWMRYVDFIENKGGREIANLALDRASKLFFKNVSAMRLFDAWFKEKIGDVFGARAAICYFDMEESDADFIGNVTAKANMEKRLGNLVTASNIYKQALDKSMSSRALSKCVPALFVHYSRHLYMTTSNANTAWDVLIDGIRQLPQCKLLYEELISFATTHGGREHLNAVETVMANVLYSGPTGSTILDARDAEELSNLYIKFVDQVGSIYDVRKAWMQHVRSFPDFLRDAASANHAQEAVSSKLAAAETRRTCTGSEETAMDSNQGADTMHGLNSPRNLVPERCDLLSEQPNVAGTDGKFLLLIKNNDSQSVGASSDKLVAEGGANNGVVHATQSRALKQLGHASPNVNGSHEDAREAHSHRSEQNFFKDSNLQETDLSNKRQTSPSLEKLSLDPWQYQPYQSMTSFYNTEATCEETRASEGIVLVGGSQETRRFSAKSWPVSHRTGKVPNTSNRSQDADGGFPRKDRSSSPGFFLNEKDRGNDSRGWQQQPSDKFLRDSKFGPRGQLRKKSNYHQHLSPSSHKQADATIPATGQGLSGTTNNQQSLVNPAAWPMQNLHQPQHLSQPSAVGTQAPPMFQNPSQSSEQQGNNVQNSQAYDVMWQQYYYYQAQQQVIAQQQQLQPSIQMTQNANQSQTHPLQSYDPQQLQHYYQQQQWQFHQQQLQAQQPLQQQQLQAQQPLQQQQLQQQFYNQEQQHQQLQAQQPYNQQQQQYQQLQVQQPVMHQSYDQQQLQQGEPPQDLHKLNLQSKGQVKGEDI